MGTIFGARALVPRSVLWFAVSAVLSGGALAQTPESSALEEIVVTAERREVSLQEVPASATVLSAESIAQQGIDNVIELQQVAPSVAINTYNRGTFINIRGVGIAQSAPTSNPGVAYYIDGNYIPHETFISQSFYDIESIEVLRGPQGTLTGQNSTAGAIYIRTPAPELGQTSGYIDVTAADYEWYRAVGAVNVPLGEKIAVRLAGVYDTKDSFTDNIGPSSSEPGSGEMIGARAAMRIKPFDSLTLDLRYEYFDYQTDYNAIKNRNDRVSSDPFVIQEDAISFLNQDGYRASAEARVDIGSSMQFRALTSYLDGDNFDQADGDRTATALPVPPPLPTNGANTAAFPGRVGYTAQSFETSVTEVNLLSTGESRFQWVTGAFYMTEKTPVAVLRDNRNTVTLLQSNSTIRAEAENTSTSVFGQADIRITDSFALDFGARYSEDEQEYTRFELPPAPPPAGNPPGCFPCATTIKTDEVTGRVGLKYFAGEDTMLYGTVSRGYKAGGVNLDPRLGFFQPEINEVAELGMKTTVADGRLRINGNVFYSEYEGIQLSALTRIGGPTGPLSPNTVNGPAAEIYGAELESLAQFGGLGINFGISYLQTEFVEQATIVNTGTNLPQTVFPGAELPFAPEITASAGIQYDIMIGDMTLTPRFQSSYIDEQNATPFPSPTTIVPSRVVSDVRLTLLPTEHLKLEGFVTNVFDKTYIAVQVQDASSAAGGFLYGAPRQYGVRLKYSF
jgi:iron complex outermembrane recepter protein